MAEDYAYDFEEVVTSAFIDGDKNKLKKYPLVSDATPIYGVFDSASAPNIGLYEKCNWALGNTAACAYGVFMGDDTVEHSVCIKEIQSGKLTSVLKFLRTEYRLDTFKLVPMLDVKTKLQNLPLILETFETRGDNFKNDILGIMVDRDKLISAGAILEVV